MARAQPGGIQLLITDMVMPGMTGREFAEALAAKVRAVLDRSSAAAAS